MLSGDRRDTGGGRWGTSSIQAFPPAHLTEGAGAAGAATAESRPLRPETLRLRAQPPGCTAAPESHQSARSRPRLSCPGPAAQVRNSCA